MSFISQNPLETITHPTTYKSKNGHKSNKRGKKSLKRLPNGQYSLTINLNELRNQLSTSQNIFLNDEDKENMAENVAK